MFDFNKISRIFEFDSIFECFFFLNNLHWNLQNSLNLQINLQNVNFTKFSNLKQFRKLTTFSNLKFKIVKKCKFRKYFQFKIQQIKHIFQIWLNFPQIKFLNYISFPEFWIFSKIDKIAKMLEIWSSFFFPIKCWLTQLLKTPWNPFPGYNREYDQNTETDGRR